MSLEILKQVQQAEEKGQKIRALAQQEAREVIKGSEMAIVEQEKQAAVDHKHLFNQMMEEKKQGIQGKIDGQAPEQRRRHQALIEKSEEKVEEAVSLIVERIVNYGNS